MANKGRAISIGQGRFNQKNNQNTNNDNKVFMKGLLDDLDRGLDEALSLENVQKYERDFQKINSSSALRKVYDAFLDFYDRDDFEIQKTIWIAKLAYQEKRKSQGKSILPAGFASFMDKVYKKLDDKELFKKFLEAFVAYHKYFNPKS